MAYVVQNPAVNRLNSEEASEKRKSKSFWENLEPKKETFIDNDFFGLCLNFINLPENDFFWKKVFIKTSKILFTKLRDTANKISADKPFQQDSRKLLPLMALFWLRKDCRVKYAEITGPTQDSINDMFCYKDMNVYSITNYQNTNNIDNAYSIIKYNTDNKLQICLIESSSKEHSMLLENSRSFYNDIFRNIFATDYCSFGFYLLIIYSISSVMIESSKFELDVFLKHKYKGLSIRSMDKDISMAKAINYMIDGFISYGFYFNIIAVTGSFSMINS